MQKKNQMDTNQLIDSLNNKFEHSDAYTIISECLSVFGNKIAFASSLGLEDQAITQIISKTSHPCKIFTLDTGRMFYETYDLIEKTQNQLKVKIEIYFPQANLVEPMVKEKGINLFFYDIEQRKECCNVRKIEPLRRALKGLDAWICGLRRDQSVTRKDLKIVEWDSNNNLIKINPLLNWSESDLNNYIKSNKIPYNTLHDKGYPSIGCAPCTRAISEGEDVRAGRWWWENPETKECGLHKKN